MQPTFASHIPRQNSGYQLEDFEGELVLYHIAAAQVIYLNETATLIWRPCDGQRSTDDIWKILEESYPEAADRIERDLQLGIEQLVECGAIELVLPDSESPK